MTDKPIIFSAPMVRALLDGRKTQTRRVLKPQPYEYRGRWWITDCVSGDCELEDWVKDRVGIGPRYAIGDRLYVREAFTYIEGPAGVRQEGRVLYRADATDSDGRRWGSVVKGDPEREVKWRPSIHMPRWASRLTLTVTDVRVQRLQDISEADATAEGARAAYGEPFDAANTLSDRRRFELLWNSIHGPDAWQANPFVVAISFTVAKGNIDG